MTKRLDQITFKQLRALEAIANERAINRAAETLGLTAPAVHNQLKTLEDLMECPLLDRAGSDGIELTENGRCLLAAYMESRGALERAISHVGALSRGFAGSVVLGVVSTGKYFAPGIVARLRKELPDVNLRLEVGNRSETILALKERRYDLCIMGRPPRVPHVDANALAPNPHLIVCAPDHRLARGGPVSAQDLLQETFVMREQGSGTRMLAVRYLDDLSQGQDVEMIDMGSNETIKQAVISGLGIAMLSGHTVVEELRTGRLVSLDCPGIPINRQWFLVERTDQTATPTTQRVREWLLEFAPGILSAFRPV